jgi:hypothetical protein
VYITLKLNIKKTEGPRVDNEDVESAILEELDGFEFEAGDEPSIFTVERLEVVYA